MKKNCCGVYYKWIIIQNQTVTADLAEMESFIVFKE